MESCYRVILDSNFLMVPFQFKVDIFKELERILDIKYKVYVTKSVLHELEKLSSREAKAALRLAARLDVIQDRGSVDSSLYRLASKKTIICTNDKNLKEKIRKKGSPVIYLRQERYLEIDGNLE